MTNEEAKLTIEYLKEMQEKYIEGEGYERHPIPEWYALDKAIETIEQTTWIPVSEKLPETDYENTINNCNVLLWVKNKTHPEREPQIYLGKLRHVDGDDGSGNFWGIETKPCDWTIWGWCYLNEPEVIAWMPLPEPYKCNNSERYLNYADQDTLMPAT